MFHFVRRFHKEVGVTPVEYLNRFRIEQAKRLLLHSEKPVAQIGAMVGVPNPTHFGRLFRRYVGVMPLRFRLQEARARDAT
jgi:transcriptional regulator GlxA family with amidase domain